MMKHDGEHRLGFGFSWFFPTKPSSGVIPLFFIIFLIVLLAAGRASAAGVPFFISADVSEYKSGEPLPADAVSIFEVEGKLYLFIPSGWDCGRLRILGEDGMYFYEKVYPDSIIFRELLNIKLYCLFSLFLLFIILFNDSFLLSFDFLCPKYGVNCSFFSSLNGSLSFEGE